MGNQLIVMRQIPDKDPTELYYIDQSVFRKNVNYINDWIFELGSSGGSTPTSIRFDFTLGKQSIHKYIIMQYLMNYTLVMRVVK